MSTWTEVVTYIKTQLKPGVLGNTNVQKILNSVLAVIQQINAGDFTPSSDFVWNPQVSYSATIQPVLWQDQWLVSNIGANQGNVPISTSGVLHPSWRIIGSSAGSGIRIWEPIVYPNSLEVVYESGQLYYLNRGEVGADPFVSVDFSVELSEGKWVAFLDVAGLSLPLGGTSNQVLTKLSANDGDAGWETVKPPLHIKYTSQSSMLEDQVNQLPGYAYFDGLKEWRKLETSTEVIDDYREIGGGGGAAASITTIGASASTDPSLFRNVNVVLVSNTKITLIGTYETTIAFQTIYRVKQAYSGGRILTWAGKTVIWQGGQVPIVDTEANSVTFINLYWDGSDLYGYKSCGF
jgi:hypothetical protein